MNGSVVANTGPIIALAIIGRLEALRSIFHEIAVPQAVHGEILEGGDAGPGVSAYLEASWISRRELRCPPDPLVESVLDKGEASVIQLAPEMGADRVLIDERKARKIARDVYGLKVVGSAGILVETKRLGLLESVKDDIVRMRDAGYRIHDDIVSAAMSAAGES